MLVASGPLPFYILKNLDTEIWQYNHSIIKIQYVIQDNNF